MNAPAPGEVGPCPAGNRPDLEALPERMRGLKVDARGYPVPWFVAWVDGAPEFRAMDGAKFRTAVKEKRCWVCGEPLGRFLVFVTGPMCGVSRTSSEPPSHQDCARWSARNCPFLTRRQVKRREDDFTRGCPAAGVMIPRNPGVSLLWSTHSYKVFADAKGMPLIRMGDPIGMEWWSHGRLASVEEIEQSIQTGLPALLAMTRSTEETEELATAVRRFLFLRMRFAVERQLLFPTDDN